MTKEIPLTQGKVALVDDEDHEWLSQWRWQYNKRAGYAQRSEMYRDGTGTSFSMHAVIMNTPKGMHTDHIDGNRLNNQRSNLRVCTCAQNLHNSKKTNKSCHSQYKGVTWRIQDNKWWARITFNCKSISIGLFKTELDAARAYDRAAREYFGEFARLNFPDEAA